MKRWTTIPAIALVTYSCGFDIVAGDATGTPVVPYIRGSLYAAAVAYPPGYDFRRDSLGAKASPEILFFRDDSLLFSFPALNDGKSPGFDADMHRIAGNHLYSDYNTGDGSTCIAEDGKELFRYEGREMIRDLICSEGDIYTLGTPRAGAGWSFRKNGLLICSRDSGEPAGRLHRDGHKLCFAYSIPNPSSTGGHNDSFFFVSEGVDSMLDIRESASHILEIMRFDGGINILSRNGTGTAIWQCKGRNHMLDIDGASTVDEGHFIHADGKMYACITYSTGRTKRSALWEYGSWKRVCATEPQSSMTICTPGNEMPVLCFAESYCGKAEVHKVRYGTSERRFSGELLLSPGALCCDRESFAIGLNDVGGDMRPITIRGLDTTEYDFNGYFIHLALP